MQVKFLEIWRKAIRPFDAETLSRGESIHKCSLRLSVSASRLMPSRRICLRSPLLGPCFSLQLINRRDIYRMCVYPLFRGFLKAVSRPPQSSKLAIYRFGHLGLRSHPGFPLKYPFVIRIVRLFAVLRAGKNWGVFKSWRFRYY